MPEGHIFDPEKLEPQKSEFDGTVAAVKWTRAKKFREGREAPEQLELTIRPTSYEGKDRFNWINYSQIGDLRGGRPTNWAKFTRAVKACGLDLSDESGLVGKNFHWVEEISQFEIEGDIKTSSILLPTKLNVTAATPSAETKPSAVVVGTTDLDKAIIAAVKAGASSYKDLWEKLVPLGHDKKLITVAAKNLDENAYLIIDGGKITVGPEAE